MNPPGHNVEETEQLNLVTSSKKQGILLFTHSARQEAAYKQLTPKAGGHGSRQMARIVINRTRKIAESTGIDLIVCDTPKQQGDTFAERFARAVEEVFNCGYKQVVAIGNDTPELNRNHLEHAFYELKRGKTVLGPSHDGGVYLIGLDVKDFDRQKLLAIPWKTNRVYTSLTQWLESVGPVSHLQKLRDIDSLSDLRFFLRSPVNSISRFHLRNKIESILRGLETRHVAIPPFCISLQIHDNQLTYRGPPQPMC